MAFNIFMTEKKSQTAKKPTYKEAFNFSGNQNVTSDASSSMDVFVPKGYDDVSAIIDVLVLGKPSVVNIKELKFETAQRVLDLISGAIYALHGGICEIDQGIFLLSPNGVSVK